MFEVRMPQAALLKKILDAIKDLVTDGNFDCSTTGISLQAMDSSHVSLVTLFLRADGFEAFRCDRSLTLGMSLVSLSKILKCAGNDDVLTLKAEDSGDVATFMFENKDQDRVSDFELKLMDIDGEHLGIPDTDYKATIRMPATEFQRICRDLQMLGDAITIAATKEGVKFSASGDIGSGNITIRQNPSVEKPEEATVIQLQEPVTLKFALRYLNIFTKATPLSGSVTLSMSPDVPIVVEYRIEEMGHIRFYLAPKIDEGDEAK
eukprot:TRINITY_DN14379_c0_g1_i1.p1 TRINITY_DN14379_c0_g1~~TRINITY_DN14379_c0_g1_i1.p1  ORF type:complete len:275 (+),score=66.76 TRINITY_DN14379_c0_g1_i1:37-825(+)